MFRDKKFLIEKGMYPSCRTDVFYIVGSLYDEVEETGKVNEQRYIELKQYLEEHRKELLDNADYPIAQFATIKKRFKELIPTISFKKVSSKKKNQSNIVDEDKNNQIILSCNFNKMLCKNSLSKRIKTDWANKTGIYGIFEDDNLIYIGKTENSFKDRFYEHKQCVKNNTNNNMKLYPRIRKGLEEGKEINFLPLIIIEDLEIKNKRSINNKELSCMELALITVFQPECNLEGVVMPYRFN
jgi:hypothetical protein